MIKYEFAQVLVNQATETGVIHTIHQNFGHGVKVEIGFSSSVCALTIDEINFSVRSMNALKRANIFTVGDTINALQGEDLLKVRNLGKKSLNEIKTKILAFGYEQLSHGDKISFFHRLIELNNNP